MIEYKVSQLSELEIFTYLNENENLFYPNLSSRLDIKEYSIKLHKYATHFCAYDKKKLIGLIACYFNDHETQTGFISSVSVIKNYQRKGIAKDLLKMVISFGKRNTFKKIKLEVNCKNHKANSIYKRSGFIEIECIQNNVIMELSL